MAACSAQPPAGARLLQGKGASAEDTDRARLCSEGGGIATHLCPCQQQEPKRTGLIETEQSSFSSDFKGEEVVRRGELHCTSSVLCANDGRPKRTEMIGAEQGGF